MKKAVIRVIFVLVMALTLVIGSVSMVSATDPVYFGGHYYQIYNSSGITWQQANTLASGMTYVVGGITYQGHLAVITSAGENAFVYSQLVQGSPGRAWIGASQLSNQATVLEGWEWVTAESMSYTNWDTLAPDSPPPGSPNDAGGISGPYYHFEDNAENYMEMRGQGYWDDVANYVPWVNDYVVEFEPPTVYIDIMPGGEPNSVNLKKSGVIPVAILGSADVDVTGLFGSTFSFCGATQTAHAINDLLVFNDHIVNPYTVDDPDGIPDSGDETQVTANNDLYPDLVVHFKVADLADLAGLSRGDVVSCYLTITSGSRTLTTATDTISIVK